MNPMFGSKRQFEARRLTNYIGAAARVFDSRSTITLDQALELLATEPPFRNGRIASVSRNSNLLSSLPGIIDPSSLLSLHSLDQRERMSTMLFSYISITVLALERAKLDGKVLVATGDVTHGLPVPILCKARNIDAPGLNVLIPLEYARHFGPALRVSDYDKPFREKRDSLVWRGAFTGPTKTAAFRRGQSREWVFDLAVRTAGNPIINTRISYVPPDRCGDPLLEHFEQWGGESMTIAEQLDHKLLLSVEGNDVASGLKWMMASQSCVLMPEPTVESWFCETFLEPWEHYVPVRHDLGDVEEKVDWCLSHPLETGRIASQGSRFARKFFSATTEDRLFTQVLTWYTSHPALHQLLAQSEDLLARRVP
jgi:hypothetical protein